MSGCGRPCSCRSRWRLWIVHAFGWGTLGVLCFSAELVRQHDLGRNFFAAGLRAGLHCLPLVPPVALMLLWRSKAAGVTTDWFNWARKLDWLIMALRDRWEWFDVGALVLVACSSSGRSSTGA